MSKAMDGEVRYLAESRSLLERLASTAATPEGSDKPSPVSLDLSGPLARIQNTRNFIEACDYRIRELDELLSNSEDREFYPFHSATTLALTSTRVVGLRLEKIAAGGVGAFDEAQLMVSEKLSAAFEAAATLASGGTSSAVMDRYQALVNANVRRLSRR